MTKESMPVRRPIYTEKDLPEWGDEPERETTPAEIPVVPNRPQYGEDDFPVWEENKQKTS